MKSDGAKKQFSKRFYITIFAISAALSVALSAAAACDAGLTPPFFRSAVRENYTAAGVYVVNINAATQKQLEMLEGIGPVLAGRIISLREQRGGFAAIDELLQVEGIGVKTLDKIRRHLLI